MSSEPLQPPSAFQVAPIRGADIRRRPLSPQATGGSRGLTHLCDISGNLGTDGTYTNAPAPRLPSADTTYTGQAPLQEEEPRWLGRCRAWVRAGLLPDRLWAHPAACPWQVTSRLQLVSASRNSGTPRRSGVVLIQLSTRQLTSNLFPMSSCPTAVPIAASPPIRVPLLSRPSCVLHMRHELSAMVCCALRGLTTVTAKSTFLSEVTPYCLADCYRRFGETSVPFFVSSN